MAINQLHIISLQCNEICQTSVLQYEIKQDPGIIASNRYGYQLALIHE